MRDDRKRPSVVSTSTLPIQRPGYSASTSSSRIIEDAVAEGVNAFVGERVPLELVEARCTVDGDQAEHGPHRELGLMHGGRISHRTEHIDRALMHARGGSGGRRPR